MISQGLNINEIETHIWRGRSTRLRGFAILLAILTFSTGLMLLAQIISIGTVFGHAAKNDFGYNVALDSANNIIIAGTTESYGAGLDDVFVTKYSSSKMQLWSVTWGGSGNDQGYAVAVDSIDNIIVTGQTNSFGAGGTDAFVVKYSPSGSQLWNKTWGGSNSECGFGVAVDAANNIIMTGYTNSSGAGLEDVFIVKYSSLGVQLWSDTWGESYNDRSCDVAIDSIDNIILAGYTDISSTSVYNALVLKYSSSGVYEWNLTIGGGSDIGHGVSVDSADNIIITGYKFSSVTSSWDAFIAKCHSTGVLLWNRAWGGAYDDRSFGVALDSSDNIFLSGTTESFGAGGADVFVAKYSVSGSLLWNTTWGGSQSDYGYDVAVDSTGTALVAGYTDSFGGSPGFYDAFILHVSDAPLWQTTFGESTTDMGRNVAVDSTNNTIVVGFTDSAGAEGLDAFIAKYSSSGVQLWNTTWGGIYDDRGYSVAVDSTDNIIITGYTSSFGLGGDDAFVVKYASSGSQLWNCTWGESSFDRGRDVDVDSADNIIITGYTYSFGVGGSDAFVAKYSASGVQLWNSTWGESKHDRGYGNVVDSTDNIVIVGTTESLWAEGTNTFIAKYSSMGVQLWNTTWGGFGGGSTGYAVAVDSADNIIITGQTSSFIASLNDAFIVKYSPSGDPQWSRTWGGSNNDCGYGVAVDTADSIIIAGETYRSTADGIDAFVVKYSPMGVPLWNLAWGGSDSDYGYGVAVDQANSIFMAGTTRSFGAGSSDAFIVKYPSSGFQFWHILWEVPYMHGDVDGDGDVDSSDLVAFSNAYGSESSKLDWSPGCDFNNDGKVDASDLFELSKNFGKTV